MLFNKVYLIYYLIKHIKYLIKFGNIFIHFYKKLKSNYTHMSTKTHITIINLCIQTNKSRTIVFFFFEKCVLQLIIKHLFIFNLPSGHLLIIKYFKSTINICSL